MKRFLVFEKDESVPTPTPFGKVAYALQVGDFIIQTGRKLKITSVKVNGRVQVTAED